ncbi:orphan protein [Pandoravirus kuranda]|uniref:Orphan protein n=1 Tax=Pandoravirus kuranda TaxID=3019033 RepID=A0AA95EDV1_9VIRU|nr:orphan protein [Pandoravirus kuranda]
MSDKQHLTATSPDTAFTPCADDCKIDAQIVTAKKKGQKCVVVLATDIWPEKKWNVLAASLGSATSAAVANASNSSSPMHTAVKNHAEALKGDGFTVTYSDLGPSLNISWQ